MRRCVAFVSCGEYVFPTLDLANKVQKLARGEKREELNYVTKNQYWEELDNLLVPSTINLEKFFREKKDISNIEDPKICPLNLPFKLPDSIEKKVKEFNQKIQLILSNDESSINVGQYKINPDQFYLWIIETTAGGLAYWEHCRLPPFGRETRTVINNSTEEFFKKMDRMFKVY